tara:strand:+ start:4226 stop:4900 length:675 start_codon:yes stop_codon:yes gene_type:complete
MAVITDYASLLTNIQELTEDDGAEFLAYVPTLVDLAEERLFREMDFPEIEQKATGTLTALSPNLVKPLDYEFAEFLYVTISGVRTQLRKKMESYIVDFWPTPALTDVPRYYCDADKDTFIIAPTPDSNYAYELKYTAKPLKLSVSNSTNYYIENCKDVLFSACMLEAAIFLKAWSQIQVWEGKFNQHRDTWNLEVGRYRGDGNMKARLPASGPNSLKHTLNTNA